MIKGQLSIRYGAVSIICLFLGMILIPLLDAWGLHYAIATLAAFSLVTILGFSLHCRWTFTTKPTLMSFVRYASAMALNLPLTVILIAIGHDLAGLSVAIATAIASTFLYLWNFAAVRWAVHRPSIGTQQ